MDKFIDCFMESKSAHELDLESEELRKDHKNFLDEIGIYFFILRIERNLKPTPIEKFLRITPGVILQIEAGEFNWSTDMLEDIWDYYFSVPVKRDLLSRFNVKNRNSLLARLIKIGLKRNKFLQKKFARKASTTLKSNLTELDVPETGHVVQAIV